MPRIGAELHGPISVGAARQLFFERIMTVAPEVLESLRNDVLPHISGQPGGDAALVEWAKDKGLADDWALTVLRATVKSWREHPFQLEDFTQLYFSGISYGDWVRPPTVSPCRPFEPMMETWAAFEQRVEEWVDANRNEARKYAELHGLRPSAQLKAKQRSKDPAIHFNWLVHYQVQGWQQKKIASKYRLTYDAKKRTAPGITKALNETARLIGLTLRK